MSIQTIESPNGSEDAQQGAPNAAPGQDDAALAQQQTDDGQHDDDQSQGSDDSDSLTEEQKTIRKQNRRIDRLTAKRGGLERENELLRQQIADFERRQQQGAANQRGNEGEDHGGQRQQSGRQVTEADIERMAQTRAEQLHRQRFFGQRVSHVLAAGSKLDGFNAAVDAVAEVAPFTDRQGRPTPFIEAVLEADDPAALLKHLGDNPDDAEQLAFLTPAQLGRRIAKLEDQIKAGAKKQTSAAPPPLKPVAGAAGGAEPDPEKDAEAWIRARNKAVARA